MAQKMVILSEDEYDQLMKWKEFSEKVWLEVGPYGHFKEGSNLSNELRYQMQDLFKFDDSE